MVGQWLQTLFHFDFNWTAERVDQIFPEQPNLRGFWNAAWSTFMDFGGPYDPALDVLRGKYAFAIGLLEQESEDANKRMGERSLGKHLASYFSRALVAHTHPSSCWSSLTVAAQQWPPIRSPSSGDACKTKRPYLHRPSIGWCICGERCRVRMCNGPSAKSERSPDSLADGLARLT